MESEKKNIILGFSDEPQVKFRCFRSPFLAFLVFEQKLWFHRTKTISSKQMAENVL